jgi:pSer/pThr/pTyr-binding forkhead associated (FHA) protein
MGEKCSVCHMDVERSWGRCPYGVATCPIFVSAGAAAKPGGVMPTRVFDTPAGGGFGAATPAAAAPPAPMMAPPPPAAIPMPTPAPPPAAAPAYGGGQQPASQAMKNMKKTRMMEEDKKLPVVGWLVALTGKHKGEDFRIREGKNTVGSAPTCDICLLDEHVSSKHANINYVVKADERVFVLVDLDSTNGTFLNDSEEPIYHEELVDNDTITFGTTKCKFKCL